MRCPQVAGGPMARVAWHFPFSGTSFTKALTYHRGCCRQSRAGSGHAEPPLSLQPAVAVLVGDTGRKAHAAGG